ncbi:TetR family transcriptional regulator [Dictyobacter alpinus]|uniref:TetR family transcriptional regulator n=1 Tax=Dictyobacter alpinus TaxID=2014873 RepID=A0A402BEC3_9CHLR|nr:TetR/AcrR family transcriptional regulator [Dictyobacter alpinus]GCE29642.1 TetR family transcriptional regulator [Dictyobacter alpinus]
MTRDIRTRRTTQKIVQAASELILTQGVAHLTLEAVAKKAGVSKGGLLHHYPSKEALISGLVNHLDRQFDEELQHVLAAEQPEPGSWLRAYIRTSLQMESEMLEQGVGLLATLATNPELLAPFQQSFARYQQQAQQAGIDPVMGTIIRLAVDGLWLSDLFHLTPPVGDLREQVVAKLIEMSRTTEE